MTRIRNGLALALLGSVLLVACGGKPAPAPAPTPAPAPAPAPTAPPAPAPAPAPVGVAVASIELGTATGAPATPGVFATTDAIVATVATTGTAASATLLARWTYQDGQVVNESTQQIAPTGPASTTFKIEKPDGWPAGKYAVEVLLDGASAGKRDFEVR